ncbi:MAG TPA: DJ-1/PfpI family protein, partial [Thermoleophilaceae bacterium]|nr:DJ-1/PfpI family protein [Thermoleophilaceae bacterium]
MTAVDIVVYDGFDELDAVAPFEILAAAGLGVRLVTLADARSVRTAHGMSIAPHGRLGEAPELLVVPGGGWASRAPRGAWAEVQAGTLPAAVA